MTQRSEDVSAGAATPRWRRELRGYVESLAVAFLVVTFVFNTVGVVGASMDPTLDGGPGSGSLVRSILTGDRVFLPKYETWLRRLGLLPPYERGDIVVLRQPANAPHAQTRDARPFFIKRVVGVPGDRIRIAAGTVHLNGAPLDESYLGDARGVDPVDFPAITQRDGVTTGWVGRFVDVGDVRVPSLPTAGWYPPVVPVEDPWVQLYYGSTIAALAEVPEDAPEGRPFVHELVVPAGSYFVMGDNRRAGGSEDSRLFGPVPQMLIAGRASAVVWPPRRDGGWNWRLLEPPRAFAGMGHPAE